MKIEIWSDYVCPFCYIGKRRLELALKEANIDAEIVYKAYQLDPYAKTEANLSAHEALAKKYGITTTKAKQMNENVKEQAKTVGLNYNIEDMQYPNTLLAHRLVKFAETKGLDKELAEAFFKAHFIDAKNIGLKDTLVELARKVGLDNVDEVLNSDIYSSDVVLDIKEAKDIGVRGVPFFVINRKYAISGAQPLNVFQDSLKQIYAEEKSSLKTFGDDDGTCTDDGCEIE